MRLEGGDDAARRRACGRPRASPRPRSGGGRSRRRRSAPAAVVPSRSKRRPAPPKSRERGGGLAEVGAGEPARRSAPRRRCGRCGRRGRRARPRRRRARTREPPCVELGRRDVERRDRRRRRRSASSSGRSQTTACSASARKARNVSSTSRARGVGRVVVELGVGEHGDPRRELEQRAVGLVGLHDEPLPRPPAGVGARRAHLAADQVARVHPAAAQRVHDHARRRRLAVRAGDGDRRLEAGELAEQVGAVQLAAALAPPRAPGCRAGSRWRRRPRRPRARWRRRGPRCGSTPSARSGAR